MRRAMAEAEVGDDGFGEDPTVRRLEEAYAARVGKPAALFVPSGVMANQIAVRVLAPPGTMVVAGRRQHLVAYEFGAVALNAAVQIYPVDDADGTFGPDVVRSARAGAAYHQPAPSLVCVENTHMAASGRTWSLPALHQVAEAAGDVPLHMDGARLFNAEVATGVKAEDYAAPVTTVMTCLSKGLCAPVGSLLAGPIDVIDEGRLARKRLGGAMRQAGILAAAGLVALAQMVDRLAEDHRRARVLADAVAERWSGIGFDPTVVETNMVVFRPPDPDGLVAHLGSAGILIDAVGPGVLRLVTHHDVDDAGIERARRALADAPH